MSRFKKYFDNDNYQNGLRTVLILVLAVVLVVSINMFAGLIPTKIANIDVSSGHVFSISSETEQTLRAIDKPVELIYVCEAGEENQNAQIMLNLYADATDKVTARQVDPGLEPQEVIKYTGETTLDNNSVIVTSGDKQQIIYYKDYYTSGSFVLEDYLNSAISYVTGEELFSACFTKGHDEAEIDSSTTSYLGLDGFDYREVSLAEEGGVPADCKVLVINGMREDLTTQEADMIIGYLEDGGSLVLTTDFTKSSMPNLAKILAYFGAKEGTGIILESDSNRYVSDNPAYIVPYLYTDSQVLSDGVNYMILPDLSPIEYDEDPAVTVTKLLEVSENAYSVYTNIFTGKGETLKGPFTVGALFEKGQKGSQGRMIWVSSRFLSNSDISSAAGGGNITFFLNSISYLGKSEPVPSIHGKSIYSQFLSLTSAQVKMWEIIIPVIVPALALIAGVIVMIRRKRR